jgi:glucosamine-6-phosphate deaminase
MPFRYDLARFIPFRDAAACARVRVIPREKLCDHPNRNFKIRIIDERTDFYTAFALDLVGRIRDALRRNRPFVAILPVGPMPQYAIAAAMINRLQLPLHHVTTFNMDEYADQDGHTAPADWPGSFQRTMMESFFNQIDRKLRPPARHINFPTQKALADYSKRIREAGGADVCYGGIGWCGHVAFWEAHLGLEITDLEEYKRCGARLVELHPMTIMQNALHSFGGDWSWVPPKANTIGPGDILGAKDRSFWLDGDLGGGISWQRFIARLAAHGPVNTCVPGSILQLAKGCYTILGSVADDVKITVR